MTGFGLVRPLPGLSDSLRINTAITLPVGVEAYGAYALGTWLSSGTLTSRRTRRYAMWVLSAMVATASMHVAEKGGRPSSRPPFSVADCRTSD